MKKATGPSPFNPRKTPVLFFEDGDGCRAYVTVRAAFPEEIDRLDELHEALKAVTGGTIDWGKVTEASDHLADFLFPELLTGFYREHGDGSKEWVTGEEWKASFRDEIDRFGKIDKLNFLVEALRAARFRSRRPTGELGFVGASRSSGGPATSGSGRSTEDVPAAGEVPATEEG